MFKWEGLDKKDHGRMREEQPSSFLSNARKWPER
jgi:hypothetical protein